MSDQAWLTALAEHNDALREVCRERDHLQRRVHALEDQIEHAGCSAAHEGERTFECRVEEPCGLCRLRTRAEDSERRVRELEASPPRLTEVEPQFSAHEVDGEELP